MIPILYVGAPGIGKTAKVKSQYDHCEILLLSSCCEEDIAGLPYREGSTEKRTIPKFVNNINSVPKNKTVCLFLDELDKSRREVADTLLTLITNPSHFGIKRPIDIVAAANPVEWGGGDGISQAMQSRFSVIEAYVDKNKWAEWARKSYSQYPKVLKTIDKILNKEIPIIESNGEGYDLRITCPRTIELAWKAMINGQEDLVYGLLTKNAASGIILAFQEDDTIKDKINKAHITSRKIGSSFLKKTSGQKTSGQTFKLNY